MRLRLLLPLLVLAALAPEAAAQRTDPRAAAGDWVFRMTGDETPQRVALVADGDSLRGRVYGQPFAATLTGDRLEFRVGSYLWRATLAGDDLRGRIHVGGDSSEWTGRRWNPPATARAYDVVPTRWPRQFGTAEAPVLRLWPGDTVRTTTLDAGGWSTGAFGAPGNRPSPGGNPATGPFYVEGTLPGDILVVKLLRVRPNRDWAFSGTELWERAITSAYARERTPPGNRNNRWRLDREAGVARMEAPPAGLASFTVPLRPFLGVVAVAPGGGVSASTRDSGPYGGNLEYADVREGATVYLPVRAEGAYLFLGDGHAAQGDGELTGDAMETSMEVAFTVEVQRYRFRDTPRVVTDEHLSSVGVAPTLDEALRDATTDLARWLETEYGLTSTEAALVLGFGTELRIPDVVGTWVSVAARLPRAVVEPLRRPPAPR